MFRPFGDTPLSEVTPTDVQGLVSMSIEEGLFVEYKSRWEPSKVSRSVASFANTYGGTLVVGVDAPNRIATRVTPIDDSGDLEDRLVRTIRALIDPVPSFTPQVVKVRESKAYLIVEVPEGTQPPYLWIRKGQILVRAGSSSEPVPANDRESIDRLYARGRRGLEWARARIDQLPDQLKIQHDAADPSRVAVHVVSVPAVHDGLPAMAAVFSRIFIADVCSQVAQRLPVNPSYRKIGEHPAPSMRGDALSVEWDAGNGSVLRFRAETTGMLQVSWEGEGDRSTWPRWLDAILEEGLRMHEKLLVGQLLHRGTVGVAILSAEASTPGTYLQLASRVALALPVPVTDLSTPAFRGSLERSATRFLGGTAYES